MVFELLDKTYNDIQRKHWQELRAKQDEDIENYNSSCGMSGNGIYRPFKARLWIFGGEFYPITIFSALYEGIEIIDEITRIFYHEAEHCYECGHETSKGHDWTEQEVYQHKYGDPRQAVCLPGDIEYKKVYLEIPKGETNNGNDNG